MFDWFANEILSMLSLGSTVLILVVSQAQNAIVWGRKKVYFLLDSEKEKRVLKRKKIAKLIAYVLLGCIFISILIAIFF